MRTKLWLLALTFFVSSCCDPSIESLPQLKQLNKARVLAFDEGFFASTKLEITALDQKPLKKGAWCGWPSSILVSPGRYRLDIHSSGVSELPEKSQSYYKDIDLFIVVEAGRVYQLKPDFIPGEISAFAKLIDVTEEAQNK
jgi:hypothetical protein